VSSDLSLKKATFESGELLSHYQRQDFRHGTRSVEGTINGELSPGTYKDFFAAALRRAYAAVAPITALSLTIAGTGPTFTVTRSTGSWLTDGIKAGQVGRITAGAVNAANLNKNLLVLSLTATVLTVMPLNGAALVAEGPIASCTWTPTGKVTYAPSSGHTDSSFAIEHWHADVAQSELFLGCKVNQLDVALPAAGMATIALGLMGKDVTTGVAAYYTTPTGETSTGILAAPNGILVAQGAQIALVTGANFSIKGNMTAEPVAGSTTYPDITEGSILVDGQLTALFQDAAIRDYFLNETEVSLIVALSASPAAAADFMAFTMPRIKFGAADKDDGNKALVQTLPFTALYNASGGTGQSSEQTTFYVQDSAA
jgi:hypothetical protein